MATMMQDLRYALRTLRKTPGFTVVAVIILALGIGATTAIFSVVDAVLLRPLPYAHPDGLVRVYSEFPNFPGGGLRRFWISPPEFLDIRRESKSWESLDGWVNGSVNLAGLADPVRATASFVTGGLLQSLGVSAVRGRVITPADDDPAAPTTADISYGLWQRAYGGDPRRCGARDAAERREVHHYWSHAEGFPIPAGRG